MPEVSRFYGISIKLYYGDHAPPHFHAEYHQAEWWKVWRQARNLEPLDRIDPLP